MSPAKLLGLPQTEDSIIVRAGGSAAVPSLPRPDLLDGNAEEDGDTVGSHSVLRSLIAIRKRGGNR